MSILRWRTWTATAHWTSFAAGCCGGMTSDGTQPLYPYDTVWLNEGDELFRSNGQLLSKMGSNAAALGDLNGDGSPDAFLAVGQSIDAKRGIY